MEEKIGKKIHPALRVPSLYTAEGLPFVVVNVVSVLMCKSLGISDDVFLFREIDESELASS